LLSTGTFGAIKSLTIRRNARQLYVAPPASGGFGAAPFSCIAFGFFCPPGLNAAASTAATTTAATTTIAG